MSVNQNDHGDISDKKASHTCEQEYQSSVIYLGAYKGRCGYCKGSSRHSVDLKTIKMSVEHYESLLNKGWRRAGKYCYRPLNEYSCCPNYSINCKALDFSFSQSLRKCIERMNIFLETGSTNLSQASQIKYQKTSLVNPEHKFISSRGNIERLKTSKKLKSRRFLESCDRKVKNLNITEEEAFKRVTTRHEHNKSYRQSLEDSLYPIKLSSNQVISPKHKLVIELNHVDSDRCKSLINEEHEIIVKYQQVIHKEDAKDWSMPRFKRFLYATPLISKEIQELRSDTDINDVNSLYITKDVSKHHQYILVKPPSIPTSYGTYHCHYLLDNRLIAVGSLDVLPSCITSIYFYYNPDYSYLNLGIYSACVEISMIRLLNEYITKNLGRYNKLILYNLGFYVHESKKMSYKLRFRPSTLLCDVTKEHVDLEKCLAKLKTAKYTRFSDSDQVLELLRIEDCYQIPCHLTVPSSITIRTMLDYFQWIENDRANDILFSVCLRPYLTNVGVKLATEILIKLDFLHNMIASRLGLKRFPCEILEDESSSED